MNKDDVNILDKNIFVFWESKNDMPGYLYACMETWKKSIPDVRIHIINYSNINKYIDGVYDIDLLKKISLPKQSDAISVAVLEKFGGLFMDVDTLITRDIFDDLRSFDSQKLVLFGYPPDKGVHVAVLYSGKEANPLLAEWRKQCQIKMNNLDLDKSWDTFGNSIIDPLLKDKNFKEYYHIIDCVKSGNILERCLTGIPPRQQYEDFYFAPALQVDSSYYCNYAKDGIISLHNSWTPDIYKNISKNEFLSRSINLANLLNYILYKEEIFSLKVINNTLENYFYSNSFFRKIGFHKNKRILVLDFSIRNINFGIDLKINSEKYVSLEIVARDAFSLENLSRKYPFPENNNKLYINSFQEDKIIGSICQIIFDVYGLD